MQKEWNEAKRQKLIEQSLNRKTEPKKSVRLTAVLLRLVLNYE